MTPKSFGLRASTRLTYYDFRSLAPGNTTTLPTDIWFKSAPRGGNLATAAETHVTGPFNFLAAPNRWRLLPRRL